MQQRPIPTRLKLTHRRAMGKAVKQMKRSASVTREDAIKKMAGVIAAQLGVPEARVFERDRTQEIVEARHLLCYVSHRCTPLGYKALGRIIGGRDHSTVIHAVRSIENRMSTIPGYAELVDTLERIMAETTGLRPEKTNVELFRNGRLYLPCDE